jgi:hypothetical protein
MTDPVLTDGLVTLRTWCVDDAEWYAETVVNDELIQRFTTESPAVSGAGTDGTCRPLSARVDNLASCAVAERAGYVRDPARDQQRQVKGETWEMAAFRRAAGS